MLKQRLIPVLFLKNGWLVRSELFRIHQNLGNPVAQVDRYNTWDVDELIYIDITPDDTYGLGRDDLGRGSGGEDLGTLEDILRHVARRCFMPLTFGGKIRTLDDARARFAWGADKIAINTQALADPGFITACATEFGSQAVVVSVDVQRHDDGRLEVIGDLGRAPTDRDPVEWCREVEARGAGEILLNAIHRDGTAEGYDLDLVRAVAAATTVPVIALGGAAANADFAAVLAEGGAHAAAAGNMFHFREHSYPLAKKALKRQGANVR